jgi:hypothetical protein
MGRWIIMTQMRLEFEKFVKENGYWIALRKVLLSPSSPNVDSPTGEGLTAAPDTTTSGHTYTDHITKARKSPVGMSGGSDELGTPIGLITVPKYIFYLRYSMNPRELDWIVELAIDEATLEPIKPFKITKYYDIQDVSEQRGINGKIIYYRCLCEESVWNVN